MTERLRFFDVLTYGVRTLFWRPARALSYIAAMSLLSYGYYMWAQSDAGMAFFTGYMQSALGVSRDAAGLSGGYFAALMAGSMAASCVAIAGAYRIYLRDVPVLRLPLQLGLDELRTLGFYLVLLGLMVGVMIVAAIAAVIIVVIFSILLSPLMGNAGASQAGLAGGLIAVIVMIPFMLWLGYALGRVSVGFALTIRDRKVSLDGWGVSKGAGVQLILAHLVLYILVMSAQLLMAPGLMTTAFSGVASPGVVPDVNHFAAAMANPYGDWLIIAVPVQVVLTFLLFGPTAAVANWDSRKRAAAEAAAAAPATAPVIEPAEGVGTGEADAGDPGEAG